MNRGVNDASGEEELGHAAAESIRRTRQNVVAIGAAVVMSVYATGYIRTQTPRRPPAEIARSRLSSAPDTGAGVGVDTTRPPWRNGVYFGWGASRNGDIQASVEIRNGRIVAATVTQCLTRYSCSWIAHLPGAVVAAQRARVDFVSGATQSSDAFSAAVADALKQAK